MRIQRSHPVPAGLVALFAAVRDEHDTAAAPHTHAARALPLARGLVDDLAKGAPLDVAQCAEEAIDAFWPSDQNDSQSRDMCSLAGFYTGIATAWLLLTAIQGSGGAR